jgi:hypothetical protein
MRESRVRGTSSEAERNYLGVGMREESDLHGRMGKANGGREVKEINI